MAPFPRQGNFRQGNDSHSSMRLFGAGRQENALGANPVSHYPGDRDCRRDRKETLAAEAGAGIMGDVAPKAEKDVTFRDAIIGGVRNWRRFVISIVGSEVAAVLIMMALVALATSLLALLADDPVSADGKAPMIGSGCAAALATTPTATA